MLTSVLHSVHPVAELLVKKVHKLAVEEALSSITGADRHNPPTLSMVWIPMSSSAFITIITRVSSSSLVGRLTPSPVPSLLLNHQCVAVHLSSLLEVSTIIQLLTAGEVVVVDVSPQWELNSTSRTIGNGALAAGQQVATI